MQIIIGKKKSIKSIKPASPLSPVHVPEDICLPPTKQSPIPALGASNWGAFEVSAHVRSAIS